MKGVSYKVMWRVVRLATCAIIDEVVKFDTHIGVYLADMFVHGDGIVIAFPLLAGRFVLLAT